MRDTLAKCFKAKMFFWLGAKKNLTDFWRALEAVRKNWFWTSVVRKTLFATESQKQCFSRRQAMSKTVLFDLVFLTPRQKVSFGPRTQNDDFLGTRPRAAPLGSCQKNSSKNSSFFVLGTKLLFRVVLAWFQLCLRRCDAPSVCQLDYRTIAMKLSRRTLRVRARITVVPTTFHCC